MTTSNRAASQQEIERLTAALRTGRDLLTRANEDAEWGKGAGKSKRLQTAIAEAWTILDRAESSHPSEEGTK